MASSNISTLFKIYSFLPKPNLLIYLDIPIEKAMKRIEIRNKKRSYYENPENLEKIQKKYEYFLKKFNTMLRDKFYQNSGNISSIGEILGTLETLSAEDRAVYSKIMAKAKYTGKTGYIALNKVKN